MMILRNGRLASAGGAEWTSAGCDEPEACELAACGFCRTGRFFEFLPLVPFEAILINHHRNSSS